MYSIIPEPENPALRQRAHELTPEEIASERVQMLVREMRTLLAQEKYGVALAAPQVGESVRLFVVSGAALARADEPDEHEKEPTADERLRIPDQVYINPEITKMSRGRKDKHEGCLSIRGTWGMVPRAEKATIRALDERGAPFTRGAAGFLAHIFQHEMDHLDGILYIDKATELYDEKEHEKERHA